jgi:hypothetical protein
MGQEIIMVNETTMRFVEFNATARSLLVYRSGELMNAAPTQPRRKDGSFVSWQPDATQTV